MIGFKVYVLADKAFENFVLLMEQEVIGLTYINPNLIVKVDK